MNIIGPEELSKLPWLVGEHLAVPKISFSEQVLATHEETHILIFTPAVPKLTLAGMREIFGTDPLKREPCMYNQNWYLNEKFANVPGDGTWHLVRKEVLEDVRAKPPEEIESNLADTTFPSAITAALTFFAWYELHGEALWKHDFLWCADRDHNGDRIYVGRYVDPDGINKNGFNIHRHLSLRSAHSAAPEITGA
ncbi:hypothetical protein HY417_01095 [Candidatus Kaiserbacteria bacterium]|nr:hypothetical protein [Candidatus Kaiserbacteria bacterium]